MYWMKTILSIVKDLVQSEYKLENVCLVEQRPVSNEDDILYC